MRHSGGEREATGNEDEIMASAGPPGTGRRVPSRDRGVLYVNQTDDLDQTDNFHQ